MLISLTCSVNEFDSAVDYCICKIYLFCRLYLICVKFAADVIVRAACYLKCAEVCLAVVYRHVCQRIALF